MTAAFFTLLKVATGRMDKQGGQDVDPQESEEKTKVTSRQYSLSKQQQIISNHSG